MHHHYWLHSLVHMQMLLCNIQCYAGWNEIRLTICKCHFASYKATQVYDGQSFAYSISLCRQDYWVLGSFALNLCSLCCFVQSLCLSKWNSDMLSLLKMSIHALIAVKYVIIIYLCQFSLCITTFQSPIDLLIAFYPCHWFPYWKLSWQFSAYVSCTLPHYYIS